MTPTVAAFGVFDGLHRGHQSLLAEVVRRARDSGAVATVVTFDPHPAHVLSPDTAPRLLATLDQRLEGFERLGIERVEVLAFDEAAAKESAVDFVERVLVEHLAVREVVVGDDVHFGRQREGDLAVLEREGQRCGFAVHSSPTYGETERFSSSMVRALLARGDIAGATAVLGRPFVVRGEVARGDQRGRELGFPTANLDLPASQAIPAVGIYAGAARVASQWWPAAISVGTRPQFYDGGHVLVEVHLLDFAGDLYGHVLDVAFLTRVRGEAVFESTEALVAQMDRDVAESREIYATFTPTASVLLG